MFWWGEVLGHHITRVLPEFATYFRKIANTTLALRELTTSPPKKKVKSMCHLFKASQVCKMLLKIVHPVPGQTQLCPYEHDLEAFRECDFDFTCLR